MRVALLPSAYVPLIGGVEELTRRLARQLVRAGDGVEVWTTRVDGAPLVDEVDGVRVRRFAMPMPPARIGPLLRFPAGGVGTLAGLLRAVRSFRPDVLHVQCFSVNGAYATLLSRLTGVPLVITLQGETVMDDHDIYRRAVSLRAALRLGLRRAAAVSGCSGFVVDDAVARFGLAPGAGRVVFNGADPFDHDPVPVPVPFERFVLCLGRVVAKKGFDLAVDAFPAVVERDPGVGLVIAGEGPFRPELEAQVHRLGLEERVHFTGALDRAQVEWAMRTAEVFVMPSRVEPFGIVALEAWRAGCPVVVSSVGGAPEFVRHDADGLVVDPRRTGDLAAAVLSLLEDPARRERLARAGAARVEEFAWRLVAGEYRRLYEEALGRSPSRHRSGDAAAPPR